MSNKEDSIHTLNEIRDLMERSSKFLSLSGLSGVFAGIFALMGAGAAYIRFKTDWLSYLLSSTPLGQSDFVKSVIGFLLIDGFCVLVASLAAGIIFTVRKGRKKGLVLWNGSSKRLLVGMLIPLVTGGIFCLAMLNYRMIWLVFPATLIFYGIALVNASRFTYPEVFYLGLSEIGIGLLSLFLTGYALLFWAFGFGILHIVYGLTMHNRYDREKLPGKTGKHVGLLIIMLTGFCLPGHAQIEPDTNATPVQRLYEKETIYLKNGSSFVKDNVLYTGQRALMKEFTISSRGLDLYVRSRRIRTIGLVISLAGAAGSIYSLASGNRDNVRKFFWISLGTGVVSGVLTSSANNLRDQAVWVRNRDAMMLMQNNP